MYITEANFRRIIRRIETPKDFEFNDDLLWEFPNVRKFDLTNNGSLLNYIFSYKEKKELQAFKAFCKGEIKISEFYKEIEEPKDTYQYIYPEKRPAYHSDKNCPALKSNFKPYVIPREIQDQGKEKVEEFRQYWRDNEDLIEEKPEIFVKRINEHFKIEATIKSYEIEGRSNSGVHRITDNRSVREINENIFELYNEMKKFITLKDSPEIDREIVMRRLNICILFGYLSWISDTDKDIDEDKLRTFKQEEVKEVLGILQKYKKLIVRELETLYMRSYIPNLDFDQKLLDSLGFIPCYVCFINGNNEL